MSGEPARLLALDLGEARIGLALSDPLGLTAQPLDTLRRLGTAADVAAVARLVGEHAVGRVVVGHPLLLSGAEGTGALDARRFAEELRLLVPGVDVVLWDERLTTAEVERLLIEADVKRRRRRQVIDGLAAVLILQNYLDACGPP